MLKRVLVVRDEHLLTDGIASLLIGQRDLDVSDICFVNDVALMEQIEEIRPSILILEMNHDAGEITAVARLLRNCPEIRIIIVDDKRNIMHVYDKQEMAVVRSADLIAAIRG